LSRMDFEQALIYLNDAHNLDPTHRGIMKQLGYAQLWAGDIEQGVMYLQLFPESQDELATYSWWWETQDEDELSQLALEAAAAITSSLVPPAE